MSESTPSSPEALLALLRDLARTDDAPEDRLAAARAAIRAGHLLPGGGAILEGGEGRAMPLLTWAATWGDVELVKLLLERGAEIDAGAHGDGSALYAAAARDRATVVEHLLQSGASPLTVRRTRESALRAAHPHGLGPTFLALKRAARDAVARGAEVKHGLATRPLERPLVPRRDRGVRELLRAAEPHRALEVVLVGSDLKATARALGNLCDAPRREAAVEARPVQDAHRLAFVYRVRGIEWTIVPFVFGEPSLWEIPRVSELAAPGAGIGPIARALASTIGCRVIHLRYDEYTIYTEHGGIEAHHPEDLNEELAALGVLVPPMRVDTDGYHVQLELFGLEGTDVERVDVVVLQELGEPAVDRSLSLPSAVPALAGAPALVGQPPLVRPLPEAATDAGPAPREAPARMSAPPPIVSAPPMVNAPSEAPAPPTVSAAPPPPIVSAPPMVNAPSEAPAVSAPPPPPIVSAPPMVSAPSDAPAPPSVSAPPPPPIVSAPPMVNAPPPSEAPPIVSAPPVVSAPPPPALVQESEGRTSQVPPLVHPLPPLVVKPDNDT